MWAKAQKDIILVLHDLKAVAIRVLLKIKILHITY